MPAPAVNSALIAYVKVVAVKTLVVGFRPPEASAPALGPLPPRGCAGVGARVGGGQVRSRLSLRGHRAPASAGARLGVPHTMTKLG